MHTEKNYYWIAPLLGGVLSLIALFTPATYINHYDFDYQWDFYIWMWGLTLSRYYSSYDNSYSSEILFMNDLSLLISSIICSLLVFIFAVILIRSANLNRTGKKEFFKARNGWYGWSALLIITTAVWMMLYEVINQMGYYLPNWDTMDPGFGVIGIFLGAMISIIGTAISNNLISQKQRTQISYIEKEQNKIPSSTDKGSYKTQQISVPKFCPICGNTVLIRVSKFCTECGFEFGREV
jgi:hypothetical protein